MATKKVGKATAAKETPSAKGTKEAKFKEAPDPGAADALARMAVRPSVNAAVVMASYGKPLGVSDNELGALLDTLSEGVNDVWGGDMKRAEAMLYAQAHALQSIFTALAFRAERQEYLKQWDAYLRMALKAQNQCRMTLETLGTIKNPPVVFARQANINDGGQQQVNNGAAGVSAPVRAGTHAPAANPTNAPSGLLEASDGEWLDPGPAGAAGGADPHLAPVGEVHRTANR